MLVIVLIEKWLMALFPDKGDDISNWTFSLKIRWIRPLLEDKKS